MASTITTLKVQILDFSPEFRDDFKRLNNEWMTAIFGESTNGHLDRPEAIIDNGGYILFAEYEGKIVGTCAILKESNKLFEIADMSVTPEFRGRNIGKQLLSEAIERVKKANARQIYLVTSSKLTVSVEMFKTYGFRETGSDAEMSMYNATDIKMTLNLK
jgi:ribosomal protein S18 acetylase RimI-like enzyme